MDRGDFENEMRLKMLANEREQRNTVGRKLGRFVTKTILGGIGGGGAGLLAGQALPTNEAAITAMFIGSLIGAVGIHFVGQGEQRYANRGTATQAQERVAAQMARQADAAARGERLAPTREQKEAQKRVKEEWERLRREQGQ